MWMLDKQSQVSTIQTKQGEEGSINHNNSLVFYGKNRNVNQTRKLVSANQYILCS